MIWEALLMLMAADGPRGHWTGTMAVPNAPVGFEVDLDQAGGVWVGSVSIPARKAVGIPLEGISVNGEKCEFRISGAPGEPTFKAVVAKDGKVMSGEFVSAGASGQAAIPFTLTLAGEAHVAVAKPIPPVPDAFVGEWEGAIELAVRLKISLNISNGPNGAVAVLTSIDQGGAKIPVSSIAVEGKKLTVGLQAVGGELTGDLDAEGVTIVGAWKQGGKSLYLSLKKK